MSLIMRLIKQYTIIFLSVFGLMGTAWAETEQNNPEKAIAFIDGVVVQTLKLNTTERLDEIGDLFQDAFAVDRISRFVVGRAYRTMSTEQKTSYADAFRHYVTNWIHTELFKNIGDINGYTIQRAIEEKRRDKVIGYMVMTTFDTSKYGVTDVHWRLRNIDGEYKVVDLVVKGVSISISQRTFFENTMKQRGGVDGLIAFLQQATPEQTSKDASRETQLQTPTDS